MAGDREMTAVEVLPHANGLGLRLTCTRGEFKKSSIEHLVFDLDAAEALHARLGTVIDAVRAGQEAFCEVIPMGSVAIEVDNP